VTAAVVCAPGETRIDGSCRPCAAGTAQAKALVANAKCPACAAGRYGVGVGLTSCKGCEAGKTSKAGATSSDECSSGPSCGRPQALRATTPAVQTTAVGRTTMVTCNTGFGGGGAATCGADRKWSFAKCTAVMCGKPASTAKNSASIGASYIFGDVIATICDTDYVVKGTAVIAKQTKCTVKANKGGWGPSRAAQPSSAARRARRWPTA